MDTADISLTLYKVNANGKLQQWAVNIVTVDSKVFIVRQYGQVNGKIQTREKEITKIKSKNTLETQALFEAQREWVNQIQKKQYSIEKPENQEGKQKAVVKQFTPMLAQTYKEKQGFKTPCMVQPKLDGVRAYLQEGRFRSRNHKEYFNMNHLIKDISKIKDNVIFDGELYNHDMTFQELMKYVKLKEIEDDKADMLPQIKKIVEYHIFDCYFPDTPDMPFIERYAYLQSLNFKKTMIHIVDILEMNTIEELKGLHDEYASQGYEGIMLRTPSSPYEFKRSKFLQKFKVFIDEEFEVIGFDSEVQAKIPLVLWICKTVDDKEFTCRPKGTHKEREELYKSAKNYIGKKLTVVFQEYTDDGIPRFPVGKGFRDDI
jgi:ATP-dependent DNA ligase